MPSTSCPRCGSPLPLPAGGTDTRVSCPQCGSQYALKRQGTSPGPTRPMRSPPSEAGGASGDPGAAAAGARRIGPYEVVQVLGRGGMGIVYKARDAALDRWVAVKTLLSSLAADSEARERFLREARAAAALSHPNLAQIYGIGEDGGTPYFAMEFVEGQTLAQRIEREGRMRPLEAIRLVRQVALGLQEAQRFSLIHRDIKPANLIVTAEGRVKITDFGLAKRARGPASMHLTATGQTIGSPLYMSPEQARGAEVDHRADIYSLGATFFHLLTGRPPFQAPTPMQVVMKHIQEPAPSPRAFAPEVSYPLAGLVQRMLRKRPEDRFPGYRALLEELDRLEAAERGGATAPQPVTVWVRERPGRSGFSLIGFIALCAGAGLLGFRMVRNGVREWRRLEHAAEAQREETPAAARRPRGRAVEAGAPAPAAQFEEPRASRSRGEARLRVVGLTQDPIPPAGMRVSGQVFNEGSAPAQGVRVLVRTYDVSGNLIGSEATVPQGVSIERGRHAPFEVTFSDATQVARVEAEVTWSE